MMPPPPPSRPERPTIRERYNTAAHFPRVTVIAHRHSTRHGGVYTWSVLGPGLLWLGQPFPTHTEAITFAHTHARQLAERSRR